MRDFHLLDYVRTDDQDAVGWLAQGTHVNDALAQYWLRQRGHGPAAWTIDAYVDELVRTRGALHEGARTPLSEWSPDALAWLRTFFVEP